MKVFYTIRENWIIYSIFKFIERKIMRKQIQLLNYFIIFFFFVFQYLLIYIT